MRIYLTNLRKYNEGVLFGNWYDLPTDIEKALNEVLGTDKQGKRIDEEWFITDYEAPFKIEEYENITELNEFAEEYEKLEEYEQKKVVYLIDQGYDKDYALEHYEDVEYYPDMKLEDVAEELVEEGLFGDITDNLKCYIDYEKIARDLDCDCYNEREDGVYRYI